MRIFSNQQRQTYIIAEIGINHNGSFEHCVDLVKAAKNSGVDAVKLQTIDPDLNYAQDSESYKLFKKLSLTREETSKIFELCKVLELDIFTTVGDIQTLEWIDALNPVAYKISSALITHVPLIKAIAQKNRPILISTGMSDLAEIDLIMNTLHMLQPLNVALFQCTSLYPAPLETLNLARIKLLIDRYHIPVGFSDHSLGIEAAPISVAAGASMIEKHFTLDKTQPGADHAISIEPCEMKAMVDAIRKVELLLGDGKAQLPEALLNNKMKFQRYVVAGCDIEAGTFLTEENVAIKRVSVSHSLGLPPFMYDSILGKKIRVAIKKDELIYDDLISV